MALCLGNNCKKKGSRTTGYCEGCDPAKNKVVVIKQTDEGSDRFISQDLLDSIPKVETLDDLRKLELLLIDGLVTGAVDCKAGSSIAALCKHQAELIKALKPKEGQLDETGRQAAVEISIKMNEKESWELMQDFTGGIGKLLRSAQAKTIDVPTITMESANGSEIQSSERPTGLQEATGDPEEIF